MGNCMEYLECARCTPGSDTNKVLHQFQYENI